MSFIALLRSFPSTPNNKGLTFYTTHILTLQISFNNGSEFGTSATHQNFFFFFFLFRHPSDTSERAFQDAAAAPDRACGGGDCCGEGVQGEVGEGEADRGQSGEPDGGGGSGDRRAFPIGGAERRVDGDLRGFGAEGWGQERLRWERRS